MGLIFYLRGLNTKGDDRLRVGRLAFGLMHSKWQIQLESLGHHVVPVLGRGGGALKEQTANAKDFIQQQMPLIKNAKNVHLLSHSTGGLVARALAHEMPEISWKSIVTLATPHRGAKLAEIMQLILEKRPRLHSFLNKMDYKIYEKLNAFRDLTPQALIQFNERYPNREGIAYGSGVFMLPKQDLSWPLRIMSQSIINDEYHLDSDGVVEVESQCWGQVIYEGQLDHLDQIGYDVRLSPLKRFRTRKQFLDLVSRVDQFIQNVELNSDKMKHQTK